MPPRIAKNIPRFSDITANILSGRGISCEYFQRQNNYDVQYIPNKRPREFHDGPYTILFETPVAAWLPGTEYPAPGEPALMSGILFLCGGRPTIFRLTTTGIVQWVTLRIAT